MTKPQVCPTCGRNLPGYSRAKRREAKIQWLLEHKDLWLGKDVGYKTLAHHTIAMLWKHEGMASMKTSLCDIHLDGFCREARRRLETNTQP